MQTELARFNPFRPLPSLLPWRRVGTYLHRVRLGRVLRHFDAVPRIAVTVSEDAQHYTIRASLPGATPDQILVSLDDRTVCILVRSSYSKRRVVGGATVLKEGFSGEQFRAVSLRHPVRQQGARASFDDGVLQLVLRKGAPAGLTPLSVQPRHSVAINHGGTNATE